MADFSCTEELRRAATVNIFALLIRCPKGHATRQGCPFSGFRKSLDLEEKFAFAENLPEEECRRMLQVHNRCLVGRIGCDRSHLASFLGAKSFEAWSPQNTPGRASNQNRPLRSTSRST